MVAPRFLLILVNCLLIFFYSNSALAALKHHHKKHHRTHHARSVHHHKARHHIAHSKHAVYSQPVTNEDLTAELNSVEQVETNMENDLPLSPQWNDGTINPKVLNLAMHAVKKADAEGIHHRNIMAIIDYSLASTQKRLWIIDLQAQHVLYNTLVAHGKTTGENIAQHFSNQPGSQASSIGLFLTKDTYQGHNGKSLRLQGLEPGFNSNALSRAIVIHGANYVSSGFAKSHGRLGRSWGCPAVPAQVSTSIVSQLKNGALLFAYAPDSKWLKHSKYLA